MLLVLVVLKCLCIHFLLKPLSDLLPYTYSLSCRHLIGFFIFLSLTIYTAMKVPNVVDIHSLHLPDVLRKADLHKMQSELMTCLPSLPNMPDLHKLRESSMDLLHSLPSWHVMDLLYNCLPERFSHNHTDVCVLVMFSAYYYHLTLYLP